MTWHGLLEVFIILAVVYLLVPVFGNYIYKVMERKETFLDPVFNPVEKFIYRIAGVDPETEHYWTTHIYNVIGFGIFCILALFLMQTFQGLLPFNSEKLTSIRIDLAINTAISFVTNTNWQSYMPEKTTSYFIQTLGLTVQHFISPAVGLCVAMALIRSFVRENSKTIGNFWVDLTRAILRIYLPVSFIVAIIFIGQGVPQNFSPYIEAVSLEGQKQIIAQGPVASQVVISQFGTNGGGFFATNSAHPYANPTNLTNAMSCVLILLIGMSMTYVFGKMVGDTTQGWVLLIVINFMLVAGFFITYYSESQHNPLYVNANLDQDTSDDNIGGNMEGKEVRFGLATSSLWSTITTGTGAGSVNAAHDSLTPLSDIVIMFNMMVGGIIGGSGSGLYVMLTYAIITVFIVCLMVGTMPEYLGKKIEINEIKLVTYIFMIIPFLVLSLTSLSILIPSAIESTSNPGPHGLSQVLYNYTSAATNNGSAFAGFDANNVYHNIMLGVAMFIERYATMAAILALAGSLAMKKKSSKTSGSFQTNTPTFAIVLIIIIIVLSGLTFLPSLALGPIAEHFMIINNKMY